MPANPTQGRQNNQGYEGLTVSPDGKFLYVLLQSAGRQEGGSSATTRSNTRFLKYKIEGGGRKDRRHGDHHDDDDKPPKVTYLAEWVVPLPTFNNSAGLKRVAAQSEVHYISDTQFLFLPRDSAVGRGQTDPVSIYRHADVFDISKATNIKGTFDAFNASITTGNSCKHLRSDAA